MREKLIADIEAAIHCICDLLEARPSLMDDTALYERLELLNGLPFRLLEGDDLKAYRDEMQTACKDVSNANLASLMKKGMKR